MSSDTTIRLQDVAFSWDTTPIFREFTYAFSGVTAVIGPSGCGKTTLVKLLAGICLPQSGRIAVEGNDHGDEAGRVGIVFQQPTLLPWMTIRQNIDLVAPGRGRQRDDWLQRLELGEYGDYVPGRISGGMQQRAALARALTIDPGVLLIDEPLTGLDHVQSLELSKVLRSTIHELGSTVVMNTHDVDLAIAIAERIILLGRPPEGVAATWDTVGRNGDTLKGEIVAALASVRAV